MRLSIHDIAPKSKWVNPTDLQAGDVLLQIGGDVVFVVGIVASIETGGKRADIRINQTYRGKHQTLTLNKPIGKQVLVLTADYEKLVAAEGG
jgi:hypothetical protein